MATAWVEWGSSGDCEWGVTQLDRRNYSCGLWDGIHDLEKTPFACEQCGLNVSRCVECDSLVCIAVMVNLADG
jgi:predicted RNA-binding Zn-ribbon protein involved in translation (DUF1610 family)